MPRLVVMLNDYIVLVRDKSKKKPSESLMFAVPAQSSQNVGRVLHSNDSVQIGKLYYFKSPFETMLFEGQEGLIMKPENLIAEITEEE
jgi:hypothetical protein